MYFTYDAGKMDVSEEKKSCTPNQRLFPEAISPKKLAEMGQATWHTSPLFNLPKEEEEDGIIAAHVPSSWSKQPAIAVATTTYTSAKSQRVSFQESEIEEINPKVHFQSNLTIVNPLDAWAHKYSKPADSSPQQHDAACVLGKHSFSNNQPTENARARALAALADISPDEESAVATKFGTKVAGHEVPLPFKPSAVTAIHVLAQGKENEDEEGELHGVRDAQFQRKDKREVYGMLRINEDDLVEEQNKDLFDERNSLLLALASPKVSSVKQCVSSIEKNAAMRREEEENLATKTELERAELAGEIARLMESYSSLGDSYNFSSSKEGFHSGKSNTAPARAPKPRIARKPTKLVCSQAISSPSDSEDKRGFSPLFAGTLMLRREKLPDWKRE